MVKPILRTITFTKFLCFHVFGCFIQILRIFYAIDDPKTSEIIPMHVFGAFYGIISTKILIFGSFCFKNVSFLGQNRDFCTKMAIFDSKRDKNSYFQLKIFQKCRKLFPWVFWGLFTAEYQPQYPFLALFGLKIDDFQYVNF